MIKCEHCGGEHEMRLQVCPTTGRLIEPERFFPPGMVLDGKYRLGKLLGTGGMGAVVEATHLMLGKTVAIKLLLPDFAENAEMAARLQREARAASATGHRNITAVTDMGRTREGTHYVVMERLTGKSLEVVLKHDAPLPLSRASRISVQILAGLEAVHRKGIVHRDLKPSNVMLETVEDGSELVKILDFGISKVQDDRGVALTTIGKVMGTPRYMSPEQARGLADLDHRADLYACGAILYALITGRPPFTANNYNALMAAILEGELTPPSKLRPELGVGVDAIVATAMAVRREQRYADAGAFRRALAPFCEVVGGLTRPGIGVAELPAPPLPAELELAPEGTPLDPIADRPAAPPEPGVSSLAPAPSRRARPRRAEPATPRSERLELEPLGGVTSSPGRPLAGDDAPLELALPPRPDPPPAPPPLAPASRPIPWRALLGGALVVAAAAAAFTFRTEIQSLWTGTPVADAVVYLLVETDPPEAEVYVDGVVQVTKPIALPRSETRLYQIRVKARGYLTETRELSPDRTRAIQIKLKRAPRGR